MELVLELSSSEQVSNWLHQNRAVWEDWANQMQMSDLVQHHTLQKLVHGSSEGLQPDPEEQMLVNTVHELLKAHGAYYDNKRAWCCKAIQAGMSSTAEAVDWVLSNEVHLSRADKMVDADSEDGAESEDTSGAQEQQEEELISSWQKMVDKELFDAAMDGDENLHDMRQKLEWGANIDSQHQQGLSWRTPLHNAARNNQPEGVKLLLENGADVSPSAGDSGWTPLHNAVNFHGSGGQDCKETVRLLLKGKADVTAEIHDGGGWSGRTPLDVAVKADKKDIEDIIRLYM